MRSPTQESSTDAKKHPPGQQYRSHRVAQFGYNFLAPHDEQVQLAEYAFILGCERARQIVCAETWLPYRRAGLLIDPNGNRSCFHQATHQVFSALQNPRLDNTGNVLWQPDKVLEAAITDGPLDRLPPQSEYVEPELLRTLLEPIVEEYADNLADYAGFSINHRHWGSCRLVGRPSFVEQPGRPAQVAAVILPPLRWLDRVLAIEDATSPPETLAHCRDLCTLTPAQYEYLDAQVEAVTALRKQHPEAADDDPMFWSPFISAESLAEARDHYDRELRTAERDLRNARRKSGRRVLGKAVLRNLDPWSFPGDERSAQLVDGVPEPNGPKRRRRKPVEREDLVDPCPEKYVGPPGWVAFMVEDARKFRRNNRRDLNRWRNARDFAVSFPYGTVRQRLHSNVLVRGVP